MRASEWTGVRFINAIGGNAARTLVVRIARKKMNDGDKDHSAKSGCGERVPESAAQDPKFHKHPAADERADQSEDDVRDAAKATATRNFSRQPTGDKPNQDPIKKSMGKSEAYFPRADYVLQ